MDIEKEIANVVHENIVKRPKVEPMPKTQAPQPRIVNVLDLLRFAQKMAQATSELSERTRECAVAATGAAALIIDRGDHVPSHEPTTVFEHIERVLHMTMSGIELAHDNVGRTLEVISPKQ